MKAHPAKRRRLKGEQNKIRKKAFRCWMRLTKISSHRPDGTPSNIAIGFWLEGYLGEIVVGEPVSMSPILRTSNPRDHWDWFRTSDVKNIGRRIIRTKNSCWQIGEVDPKQHQDSLKYRSLPGAPVQARGRKKLR